MGPLVDTKPWSTRGVEGVHRFLNRAWRMLVGPDGRIHPSVRDAACTPDQERLLHQTVRKVTEDLEALAFNTAISQMMIFANALQKAPAVESRTALAFLQLIAPFAPHFAEELWARLGGSGSVMLAPWPTFDPGALAASETKLVFQVNGKFRGDQLVPVGTTQEQAVAFARANPRVVPHLEGKALRRIVYVPGKILNLVVE
jgi:leucyl-tRNA synthetase